MLLQAPAGALPEDLRPFERMDVFDLEWVSSPQISPDGRRVAYVRNGMDVMTDGKWSRIWLTDTDGSNNTPLTGRDVNEVRQAFRDEGIIVGRPFPPMTDWLRVSMAKPHEMEYFAQVYRKILG